MAVSWWDYHRRELFVPFKKISVKYDGYDWLKHLVIWEKRSQGQFADPGNQPDFSELSHVVGFKYGLPIDADLVFDVRFLQAPT